MTSLFSNDSPASHSIVTLPFYSFYLSFYGDILYYITLLCATMDSHIHHHQSYQQQNQPSSGLLRFRSAPSSLLSNLTPSFVSEDFGSSSFRELEGNNNKGCSKDLSSMNSHKGVYGGGLPPHYPRHRGSSSSAATSSSAMEGSFGLVGSMGMNHETPQNGLGSSLLRHSTSPAGLFSNNNINFQNGIFFPYRINVNVILVTLFEILILVIGFLFANMFLIKVRDENFNHNG